MSDETVNITNQPESATQMLTPVKCPVCGTENQPGEKFCMECGFQLGSTPGEAVVPVADTGVKLIDENGMEYNLKPGGSSIGREDTDILVSSNTVSRHHARISVQDDGIWVEDTGSTNGTYVDKTRVAAGERQQIFDGSTLRIGSLTFKLSAPDLETAKKAEIARDVVAKLKSEVDGTEFDVLAGITTIGRRPENDISLTGDAYISGRHARIEQTDTGFSVEDTGSTNGTTLNGNPLTAGHPETLNDTDKITFGKTELIFNISVLSETEPDNQVEDAGENTTNGYG